MTEPYPITFKGIAAAPGLAQGPLYIWREQTLKLPPPYHCDDPQAAYHRIRAAVDQVKLELEKVKSRTLNELGKEEAAIFDAHLMMVDDVSLHGMVKADLESGKNPEAAWYDACENFAGMLAAIPDPTLSARAADVRDIEQRVLIHLLGLPVVQNDLRQPVVLVARDFTPSQTATIDPAKVLAYCTAEGGPTSHTAILAKALGIPAVVALGETVLDLQAGQPVLVDAFAGEITVNPTSAQMDSFILRKEQNDAQTGQDIKAAFEPAVTRDGARVEVVANIGSAADAETAIAHGAEGVGLFRTEFLYLNSKSLPTIDQQVQAYRQVIEILGGKPLVVRTMDIGGDKTVEYLGIEKEQNPFLGWRGIRMISEKPELLRDQFYALLKAGLGTDLRIMVPMVSGVDEVIQARALFEEALARIKNEIQVKSGSVQFGIMVEVPSAALMVEHFAPYVDFFSIGTNDLAQYTLAVDRTNARVASLASAFAPPVLKLIERTVRMAHVHKKWVGMCGEFAGEQMALPFLLGVGLDEFSMSASSIPAAKRMIRSLSLEDCQKVAQQVLDLPTAAAVQDALKEWISGRIKSTG
jgi:phosphoenolpyruvate-protein phosphotransferase